MKSKLKRLFSRAAGMLLMMLLCDAGRKDSATVASVGRQQRCQKFRRGQRRLPFA